MKIVDALLIALAAMIATPVRTFLTMLGVLIGVGCMICMAAIGAGAQARVIDQIRAFGANVLLVNPAPINKDGVRGGKKGENRTLTADDARAIAELSTVAAAAPSVFGVVQVIYGHRNWGTTVNGTLPEHFNIREWQLKSGRTFSAEDARDASKVAIVGSTVVKELFDDQEALGQVIRILDTPFNIIGVLEEKGASANAQKQDDVVFVPLSTATRRLVGSANTVNRDAVAYIVVSAISDEEIPTAVEDITSLLRQRHKILPGHEDDFTVISAASALAAQQESIRTISILLGSIAAVSLVVGGIGIMNIMLVCVTERTPEIGLRLAVGARPCDIRRQFLIEAVVLCTIGGAIGVAFGSAAAWMVATSFDWPILIQPWTIVLAIAVAGLVGIFFGYYPAKRASALQPLIALRRL